MKKQAKKPRGKWLSTSAFARLLNSPERSVRRWLAKAHEEGQAGVERSSGGFYRISQSEVDRLMSESDHLAI